MAADVRLEIDATDDGEVRAVRFTGEGDLTWQEQMVLDATRLRIAERGTPGTWSDDGRSFVADT